MQRQPNNLFIYDLPPHQVTSVGLANMIKEITGILITEKPQIWSTPDSTKPFWTAVVKFDDQQKFDLAV